MARRPTALRRALAVVIAFATLTGCADDGGGSPDPSARPTRRSSTTGTVGPVPGEPAALPEPRTEVAGARWDGRIVVAGGLTADGGPSRLVHAYDPATNAWERLPDLPTPVHHFAMTEFDGRLWAVGGYTNRPGQPWQALSAARSLGRGDRAWRTEPSLGSARGAFGAAVAGERLVVVGGESGGRALPRVDVLERGARSWTEGPLLFQPREHLAVAASQGRIWAIGGRVPLAGNLATAESWDPTSPDGWRREPDITYARSGIGADEVDGRLCVVGGEEGAGTIGPVECRDATTGEWAQVASLRQPRHGLAVVALGGRLHVVSGGPQPGLTVSATHEVLDL